MAKQESRDLFHAGPFSVTGGNFVIAANTGDGYGNTVAQCFPIRVDGKTIEAAEIASLLAMLLNARMDKCLTPRERAALWWDKLSSPDSGMSRLTEAYYRGEPQFIVVEEPKSRK
jgi:hypothetical protein